MVGYEVTLTGDPAQGERLERYMMDEHIPEVLATGCFTGARFDRAAPGRWRTTYEAASQAELDRYLATHAPRLRTAFQEAIGAAAVPSREIWYTLRRWP